MLARMKEMVEQSNLDRGAIERADDIDFDTFLARANAS